MNDQLGIERWLVGVVDAGKALDLAGQRLLVQALSIALDQHLQRHIHEHLEEVGDALANLIADSAVGRYRRRDRDHIVAREHLADPADPADVRVTIFLRETQALAQVRAPPIPAQPFDFAADRPQPALHNSRYRRFPCPQKAGEPDSEAGGCHYSKPFWIAGEVWRGRRPLQTSP